RRRRRARRVASGSMVRRVELSSAAMGRLFVIVTLVALGAAPVAAQDGPAPEVARPYDEHADAAVEIAAAVRTAHQHDKRVLLVGGNWCVWCPRPAYTLEHDARVAAALARSFVVVHVDTGARGSGRDADIDQRYGHPMRLGLPVIVVLDGSGAVVTTEDTSEL